MTLVSAGTPRGFILFDNAKGKRLYLSALRVSSCEGDDDTCELTIDGDTYNLNTGARDVMSAVAQAVRDIYPIPRQNKPLRRDESTGPRSGGGYQPRPYDGPIEPPQGGTGETTLRPHRPDRACTEQ